MPSKQIKSSSSPAVEQASEILLCLGRSSGTEMNLTDICRTVSIHNSKGFSILNALCRYGIVVKDSRTKTYSLGPALMPLASKAREKLDITAVSEKYLKALAEETRASVLLGIISNDQLFVSDKYDGNPMLSITVNRNQSLHITHGAHGKAVFTFLERQERKKILASGQLFFYGDPARFDPKRLEKDMADCLAEGYAVDNGELTEGTRAVSAPVFDHENRITAAVILVGTFSRKLFKSFGQKSAAAADHISRHMGSTLTAAGRSRH